MPWANLDDGMPQHPKVVRLSDPAFRLHVAGICYAAKHTTDGFIDADMVPLLVPRYRPRTLAELVERVLWVKHGEVYEIHDYLEWNPSRDQVAAAREKKKKAGQKGARNRWQSS